MAQHAFGRKYDQRLAPVAQRLTSQQMEILRCGRWLRYLNIIFRGKLQVSFDSTAGVFWALTFIAMRQQHHQTGEQSPFIFASHNELVDDYLRAVGKVAKLRFPQGKAVRVIAAEAIFKAQHRSFREDRVISLKPCLTRTDVAERNILFFSFRIDQARVAMVQRAATRVLSGKPHWNAFNQQRSKSQDRKSV